jgi:hypothetical protein
MSNFEKMTVAQLKEYAEENSIDISQAKTKSSILSVLLNTNAKISVVEQAEDNQVIGSEKTVVRKRIPMSNSRQNENNVVIVGSANTFSNKKDVLSEKKDSSEKIALYSEKNMNWVSVGTVSKGYNIVTKEAAEMWLTRKGVRKTTPQEVATHYGL